MREWTKETFHSAYETYSTMVYRLCMLYLKNESDAKDALQDIFLKIWEKKPVFQNEMHCRAWLIQTTKHHCLDLLKSSWFKKRVAYEPDDRGGKGKDAGGSAIRKDTNASCQRPGGFIPVLL